MSIFSEGSTCQRSGTGKARREAWQDMGAGFAEVELAEGQFFVLLLCLSLPSEVAFAMFYARIGTIFDSKRAV